MNDFQTPISELRQKVQDYRAAGREDFAIQVEGLIERRLLYPSNIRGN